MRVALRMLVYVLIAYLLLSIESPLLSSFHVRMYAPDPALAVVVYAAAAMEFMPGIFTAFILGILKDGFSGGVPLGMHVEIFVAVFLACAAVSRRLDYRGAVLMSVVVVCSSLVSSLLFFVFSAIFDRDFEQFDLIFRLAIPQALISAPIGPIVGGLLSLLDRRILLVDRDGLFK